MKINIDNWEEFKVGNLFEIQPTKSYNLTNAYLMSDYGENRVVVNSQYNNGIGGYTEQANTEKGGIITFSDTTTSDSIFYQPKDFVGYPHVQGMYPIGEYSKKWARNSMLFFMTVFKSAANLRNFNYGNKFTRKDASEMLIKLPVTNENKLDLESMSIYMKDKLKIVEFNIDKISNILYQRNKLNLEKWMKFNLYDDKLFDIDMGTKLDRSKMLISNPTINFIGRSSLNNGITAYVDEVEDIEPYKKGYMTLALGGAYLGSCFIQPKEFYTSQNVVVLVPKWDMPFEVKQFISIMVFKESQTYYKAFVNELNRHIKTDFSIYLPIDEQNNPDWDYMIKYMKRIYGNVECVVEKLIQNINI